jgi:predicted amidophosphoribosyltransferase
VPIVWVLATVILWRETAAERLARMSRLVSHPTVLCPVCGYNLSGLREARCPECGGSFTLDELAASQPQRDEHPAEL